MKTPLLSLILFFSSPVFAQITSPVIKAFFGVDADLKARYFDGDLQSSDDWFLFPGTIGTITNGTFVIDTTGAASVVAGYLTDVSPWPKRMASIYRGMSRAPFSVVNNRLWLDALFLRDYHGNDTTVFTSGADKNGQTPANWSGGIQGIPDKNDILDMFMHIRRAGPNTTDSLWMFGGLSLDNVTGNRYFDFEMYQTDIYYDRVSKKWYGYGPDAGHTTWKFDAAGNIITPGDIIFSAEYQSSSLTNIEARIWIDKSSLSITPLAFNWSGQFDGAASGAQYGYASILPKTTGAFYTGLQCGNGEWAGPFSLVLQDNSIVTNYIGKQFMEFSVNLTKLGLDPVTTFGGDVCGTPFNRLVVKTRASASFTAELKDFVAPTDLFLSPRVDALTNVPYLCGSGTVSTISIQNPSPSSVYTWSTLDGHIVSTSSTGITVDAGGTYVVKQQLAAGCNPYAYDTVTVIYDATCGVLKSGIEFSASLKNKTAQLNWTTKDNNITSSFEIQRSTDGSNFETIQMVNVQSPETEEWKYLVEDNISFIASPFVFYRLKITQNNNLVSYSNIGRINLPRSEKEVLIFPNPVSSLLQISIPADKQKIVRVTVFDISGASIKTTSMMLDLGSNLLQMDASLWKPGSYMVNINSGSENTWKKFVVNPYAR